MTQEGGISGQDLDRQRFELERLQFEVSQEQERQKLELGHERLRVERFKAWWTGVTVVIPILLAVGTIAAGLWTQAAAARTQFELKAAEIVFAGNDPYISAGKANALREIFRDRLPEGFGVTFEPSRFAGDASNKKYLLELLSKDFKNRKEIIRLWRVLYPNDEVAKEVELKFTRRGDGE
jgi:hypothetical protein